MTDKQRFLDQLYYDSNANVLVYAIDDTNNDVRLLYPFEDWGTDILRTEIFIDCIDDPWTPAGEDFLLPVEFEANPADILLEYAISNLRHQFEQNYLQDPVPSHLQTKTIDTWADLLATVNRFNDPLAISNSTPP